MRLIDADALIEQIKTNLCEPCRKRKDDYNGVRCRACQYGDEIDDIEDAPTVLEWIPCSERLPEYGQAVLVALDGGSMTDGVRSADHAGRIVWDCALDNRTWYDDENIVIAWMPLPEPYNEEEE